MNIEARLSTSGIDAPEPMAVKLTVDDFLLLKRSGTFAGFSKTELLGGELSGVPIQHEDESESDASIPIKLRVRDYLLLAEAGAFHAYPKTELIDGVVYKVSPQFRPHMVLKSELAYRLRRALEAAGSSLFVGIEGSVALSETDLPQPDIILTDDPGGSGPVPAASVRLLVEVADTSLDLDLSRKTALYARRGIPEYWVADVNARLIHQMWAPAGEAYAERREVAFGGTVTAATIEELPVETSGLS